MLESEEQATGWRSRRTRTTFVSRNTSSFASRVVYFFVVQCVILVILGHYDGHYHSSVSSANTELSLIPLVAKFHFPFTGLG